MRRWAFIRLQYRITAAADSDEDGSDDRAIVAFAAVRVRMEILFRAPPDAVAVNDSTTAPSSPIATIAGAKTANGVASADGGDGDADGDAIRTITTATNAVEMRVAAARWHPVTMKKIYCCCCYFKVRTTYRSDAVMLSLNDTCVVEKFFLGWLDYGGFSQLVTWLGSSLILAASHS